MVTGTPGTGKTATSRILSERLGCHHVELSKLSRNGGFVDGYDEERDTWIVNLKKIEDHLKDLSSRIESSRIVLDGHLAHLASPKASTEIVFILRCCPEELERRLRGRGYPDKKISENILSELLDTILVEALDRFPERLICEVDVTGRDVAEVADEMLSILEGRKDRCFGEIDWIAALSDDGRIGDLLRRIEGGGGGLPHPGLR
ncbi:MAG: adenylate kinase family protein [Candidatus Bathyarchaeia archaeon]|nr:adenylate kinase family protein [Candidatus Bathyarchaeota archaeon]